MYWRTFGKLGVLVMGSRRRVDAHVKADRSRRDKKGGVVVDVDCKTCIIRYNGDC